MIKLYNFLEDKFHNFDLLELFNAYFKETNNKQYYSMDKFNCILIKKDPYKIAQMISYGNFNVNDDYFTFNDYGNLESISKRKLLDKLVSASDDTEFVNFLDKVVKNDLIRDLNIG